MNKYPADRITDNRAEFSLRWLDHERYNSPRQRRLRDERAVMSSHLDMVIFLAKAIVVFAILAIFTVLCFAL